MTKANFLRMSFIKNFEFKFYSHNLQVQINTIHPYRQLRAEGQKFESPTLISDLSVRKKNENQRLPFTYLFPMSLPSTSLL